MGRYSAIEVPHADVNLEREERRGTLTGEVFPWEEGSAAERGRGRLSALFIGSLLIAVVSVTNAGPIARLQSQAVSVASALQRRETGPALVTPAAAHPVIVAAAAPSPELLLKADRPALASRVQLGAYSSDSSARAAWNQLATSHAALLRDASLRVEKAEAAGTTVFRVHITSPSKSQAAAMCGKLGREGVDCFLVRRPADASRPARVSFS
jgi:hypothetical protein